MKIRARHRQPELDVAAHDVEADAFVEAVKATLDSWVASGTLAPEHLAAFNRGDLDLEQLSALRRPEGIA